MTHQPTLDRYRSQKPSWLKLLGTVLLGFFLVLGAGGVAVLVALQHRSPESLPWATSAQPLGEPAVSILANDLREAYVANEIAADQEYTGRTIEVVGKVTEISRTTVTMQNAFGGHRGPGIVCHIAPGAAEEFVPYQRGSQIAVVGICRGAEAYRYSPGYGELIVVLDRCRPGDLERASQRINEKEAQRRQQIQQRKQQEANGTR